MGPTGAADEAWGDLLTVRELFLLVDHARFGGATLDLIGPALRAIP